jgi:hypothetical protein
VVRRGNERSRSWPRSMISSVLGLIRSTHNRVKLDIYRAGPVRVIADVLGLKIVTPRPGSATYPHAEDRSLGLPCASAIIASMRLGVIGRDGAYRTAKHRAATRARPRSDTPEKLGKRRFGKYWSVGTEFDKVHALANINIAHSHASNVRGWCRSVQH